ncbi:MAG: antitoxin [Planctomycetes bacterium GWF2_42_9]|nr:MAG: antitoxin [Planctomycetes bacterium GWF2_42_9]HAL46057.1 antitoxin [Phycisphaerales bacterium]
MYDNELVKDILSQILTAIEKVLNRFGSVDNAVFFTDSPQGMEKLDSICMQLIVIGESLKNLDKITEGKLLKDYPEIDWRGAKGMRDIITHHYFDVDAEAIYDVCATKLKPLAQTIQKMLNKIGKQ